MVSVVLAVTGEAVNFNNSCPCVISLFFLQIITEDIGALQKNQTSMVSKIEEYKRRHLELGHRVLQVGNMEAQQSSDFVRSFILGMLTDVDMLSLLQMP